MAEFIRGIHNVRSSHQGNVVTIGSFDGVHLGHQEILQQVKEQAVRLSLPSLVMIFEPQPHEFFAGEKAPARLMRLREKVLALFEQGIDRVFCIAFSRKFSNKSADEFIEEVLINCLGTRYLVVGDDFRFGEGREGDYQRLETAGSHYGFTVTDTRTFIRDGGRVSSTRIRQLLDQSDFEQAAQLLGKPYTITGRVVRGDQLGRTLGAPTANVHLYRYRSPLSGVFVVRVLVGVGEWFVGVANVGLRPTVGGASKPILEVHLFDFDENLYGQEIVVEFKHKIREEKKFESLEQLREQIKKDIQKAKEIHLILK